MKRIVQDSVSVVTGKGAGLLVATVSVMAIVLSVVAPSVVIAVTSATPAATATDQKSDQKKADQATRISGYKEKQKLTLSNAEQTKLKGSCKAAQATVTALTTKYQATHTARLKVYDTVTKKISTISTSLEDAAVDTSSLKAAQTAFTNAVAAYKTAYGTLATDIADTSELDCVTDPLAFRAALLTARTDQLSVVEKSKAIPVAVADIQKALAEAKQSLAASQESN